MMYVDWVVLLKVEVYIRDFEKGLLKPQNKICVGM
jgi:hypothetical protein